MGLIDTIKNLPCPPGGTTPALAWNVRGKKNEEILQCGLMSRSNPLRVSGCVTINGDNFILSTCGEKFKVKFHKNVTRAGTIRLLRLFGVPLGQIRTDTMLQFTQLERWVVPNCLILLSIVRHILGDFKTIIWSKLSTLCAWNEMCQHTCISQCWHWTRTSFKLDIFLRSRSLTLSCSVFFVAFGHWFCGTCLVWRKARIYTEAGQNRWSILLWNVSGSLFPDNSI